MRKIGRLWLDSWLYLMIMVCGIIIGMLVCNWQVWGLQQKLFAAATALLPIHVLEEWHFPGGFHTMYNLMAKSDCPDRYPMNRMSDMWTNLIGVIFGCVVLIIGVNPFFCVMQLFLCCAEVFGHSSGGIFLYRQFRSKGKYTLYSPGMATTILGYLPIAVGIVISFFTQSAPTVTEFVLAIACGMVLGGISLNLPEKLLKNENTPYGYTWGDGYLSKYMEDRENVPHQQ